jgi:SP family general alpha glucoside:H+ symporter-like MFS transporter
LIGSFFAYPTFAKKYGNYYPGVDGGTYTLTAPWQSGIGNASGVGAFFGVLLNGWLVDLFGQKKTLLGSLVALAAFVFITFFAPNVGTLTAGEVLCGLPWYVCGATYLWGSTDKFTQGCVRIYSTSLCFGGVTTPTSNLSYFLYQYVCFLSTVLTSVAAPF